jgi:hypothetical protein
VFSTFGILNTYISGQITSASDFESGIKSAITDLDVADGDKKEWFVDDKSATATSRGSASRAGPRRDEHPVLAVNGTEGLTSSNPGGSSTTFTTPGNKQGCGFSVLDADGNLASCNLSALSAYNYLNTGFGSDSLTMYSSNNVTSGLTREDHMAVSQVGTGPAKFMYWQNAATVLGCIALLGFWYAIGMLAGAIKRTFSLVAAIPFATLGALSAIAKVVVYSVALILEVIVTLFIYQFVSEFLISIPDIIVRPFFVPDGSRTASSAVRLLGGIVVVLLTIVSSLVIMGVTVRPPAGAQGRAAGDGRGLHQAGGQVPRDQYSVQGGQGRGDAVAGACAGNRCWRCGRAEARLGPRRSLAAARSRRRPAATRAAARTRRRTPAGSTVSLALPVCRPDACDRPRWRRWQPSW